jgi:hypothetical protein
MTHETTSGSPVSDLFVHRSSRRVAARLSWLVPLAFGLLSSRGAAWADAPPDDVFLNKGGRLRGVVMEDDANGVSIRLVDGTTRRVPRAEIMRVQYANDVARTAAAPAPATGQPQALAAAPPSVAAPVPYGALPPLPAEKPVSRAHTIRPLWITGLVAFGAMYVTTIVVVAAIPFEDEDAKPRGIAEAFVPLAGPFIGLADGGGNLTGAEKGGLIASGIIQNVGAALFIIGVTVKVGGPDLGSTIGPSGVGSVSVIGVRGTF